MVLRLGTEGEFPNAMAAINYCGMLLFLYIAARPIRFSLCVNKSRLPRVSMNWVGFAAHHKNG